MPTQTTTTQPLHLPPGINYECDGCGKCCSGWAVPMTEADYNRIAPIDWGELLPKVKGRKLFRPLRPHEKKGTPYSNAIVEYDDGFCPFLVNKLCFIHGQRGSKFKPSMCQQFPYSFNETPSGIYATVSFVSMAVCHNTGKSLIEQREYMEEKLVDFRNLFPDAHPNWSKLELTGGKPISWDRYLEIEKGMIERLQDKAKPLDERFKQVSAYLIDLAKSMPSSTGSASGLASKSVIDSASKSTSGPASDSASDSASGPARGAASGLAGSPVTTAPSSATAAPTEPAGSGTSSSLSTAGKSALKPMDNHLLTFLNSTYFPTRILRPGENEFQVNRFLSQIFLRGIKAPLKISVPSQSYTLSELDAIQWPNDEPEIEDLLYRYFYSRIFGKFYFGAGFGQLSVITGFHHLALVYALLKLQCKALARSRGAGRVNYLDVVASVRQLEKRLGEASLSGYAAGMFELLMFSPGRVDRVLAQVS